MSSKLKAKIMLGLLILGGAVSMVSGAVASAIILPEEAEGAFQHLVPADGGEAENTSSLIEPADDEEDEDVLSPVEPADGRRDRSVSPGICELAYGGEAFDSTGRGEAAFCDSLYGYVSGGNYMGANWCLGIINTIITNSEVRKEVLLKALDFALSNWRPSVELTSMIQELLWHVVDDDLDEAYEKYLKELSVREHWSMSDVSEFRVLGRCFQQRGYGNV